MTNTVLVTGAQGFVGRYLVSQLLLDSPHTQVIGIGRSERCDRFTHGVTWQGERVPAPLPAALQVAASNSRYAYVQVDIRDGAALRRLFQEYRPSAILHLASGLRDDAPSQLFGTSVEGTIKLLEAVRDAGLDVSAIVIASSGSVYGVANRLPVREDLPCTPRDFYAVSKLAEEHVSRILAMEAGLPVIWARIFNVVGPGQDERHVAGRLAAQIAAIASDDVAKRRVEVGDLTPTRDFVDVRDVANSLIVLALHGAPCEPYNVASGDETPISAVLNFLIRQAGLEKVLEIAPRYVRPSDTPRVVADISRIRSIGYKQKFSLEQSLSDVLAYYIETVAAAPIR